REVPEISRNSILRVIDEFGVVLRPTMFVSRAESGAVVLQHYYNATREERIEDVAEVLWIGAQRTSDVLARELVCNGISDVKIIGDAYAPRRLANAIAEG